jgi:ATP-dependent helicase HrpB
LPAYAPAEIEVADLTGLALELAQWGARSPDELTFLTPPNPGAFAEARRLLTGLGALDAKGAITDHGRQLAALPLHPRLGHMLAIAGRDAAPLAALLAERDPMRDAGADLSLRLKAIKQGDPRADRAGLDRIRSEAKRLSRDLHAGTGLSPGQMAALAYPDRIGLRRPGDDPRWVLSGGTGTRMDPADPMAAARLIVVTDTDGAPRDARIRQAVALSEAELRAVHGDLIAWQDLCIWSRRDGRVLARRQERLGALVLEDRNWADAPADAMARAMLDGVRELGLVWTDAAARFRARVELVRATEPTLPAMDDATLMATLDDWLLPHLGATRTAAAWRGFDLLPALRAMLDWDQMQLLDRAAPASFSTPLGRAVPIDYAGESPAIAVRLQEMFGLTAHPSIAGQALRITLLSPAGRPVQVTTDLPGFWASSYADVRKDMRGRYPKHPWPEDPTAADPTLRAKPRKS